MITPDEQPRPASDGPAIYPLQFYPAHMKGLKDFVYFHEYSDEHLTTSVPDEVGA